MVAAGRMRPKNLPWMRATASQSSATALQDIVTGDALAQQAEAAVQTNAPAATSAALIKQAQAALQAALAAQGGN